MADLAENGPVLWGNLGPDRAVKTDTRLVLGSPPTLSCLELRPRRPSKKKSPGLASGAFHLKGEASLVGVVDAALRILIPYLTVPTVVGTGKRSRGERAHEPQRNKHREHNLHRGRLSVDR